MTTACAALGGIPMIFMNGTGAEFRQPLGYAIVGGLAVPQILTLFTTTPVVYLCLDQLRNWRPGRQPTPPQRTDAIGWFLAVLFARRRKRDTADHGGKRKSRDLAAGNRKTVTGIYEMLASSRKSDCSGSRTWNRRCTTPDPAEAELGI